MEELTKTEERIMQIFWDVKSAFIKDIIDKLPDEPKPPYNTISSVVRILVKKGYIGFNSYGNTYQYFPIVTKAAYGKHSFSKLLANYFDGSAQSLLSFMVKEETLSEKDINEIQKIIDKQ
jgi:BlaI family penicillinase repressor